MKEQKNNFGNWFRESITARMLIVGILLLVLLFPLSSVQSLIYERSARQKEVIHEINAKWGNEVILEGPILKIPYKTYKEISLYNDEKKSYYNTTKTIIKYVYMFPEKLDISSKVTTKPLHRSIYKSVVYTSDINVNGNFPKIDLSFKDIPKKEILWDKINLIIKISNLKGIRNTMTVNFNSETIQMSPKYDENYLKTIQSNYIKNLIKGNAKPNKFSFEMKVNGSESLKFIPIGKETTASLVSNWKAPSFTGKFLPEDGSRKITKDGFKSSWKVLQINRQFGQLFFKKVPDLRRFAFGTNFIIPVDEYQKTERTSKYGFMVIGLTLLVFLLIQLVSKIYIHPFQYLMIGLALVMFYTLLISISEHSSFFKAYFIAGVSVLSLITLYSRAVLKGFRFPMFIAFSLGALYSFIYVIIQLENYALLVGSIGMFMILAIIMFVSKKVDWGNKS